MPREKKRSTIVDVAKLAQVSPKSVSRVFNNEPHITPALRKKVLRAAEELNYQPNVMAQGLVRQQSYLIGLVYEKPSPSYVVELQRGALERLHGERYRLIVLPVESVSDHPRDVVVTIRTCSTGWRRRASPLPASRRNRARNWGWRRRWTISPPAAKSPNT